MALIRGPAFMNGPSLMLRAIFTSRDLTYCIAKYSVSQLRSVIRDTIWSQIIRNAEFFSAQ